jgi:hypothetical protein
MDDSIPIPLTVRFRNQTPIDTLTMAASTGQRIISHLATGEVDLCGLTPSEGARLFWEAVTRHGAPGSRAASGGGQGASGAGQAPGPALRRD